MTVYVPIVKGRESEFWALENIPERDRPLVKPILEVIPVGRDKEKKETLVGDVLDFGQKVAERIPDGLRFAVDCQSLIRRHGHPDTGGAVALTSEIISELAYTMTPVFRITDDPKDLTDVSRAVQLHRQGACLRLPWTGARGADKDAKLSGLLRWMGLAFNEVDLLIDLWAVESGHAVKAKVRSAREALAWAARMPWRSVTLAAGAFPKPELVSAVPFDMPDCVPRWDARVWMAAVPLSDRNGKIRYADYGTANPRMPSPSSRARHPKLLYTVEDHWMIYRCSRGGGRGGFDCFRKLCETVMVSEGWPPQGAAFSWGDQHIKDFAQGGGSLPNTPVSWRACAQSHHMAVIRHRLDRFRIP